MFHTGSFGRIGERGGSLAAVLFSLPLNLGGTIMAETKQQQEYSAKIEELRKRLMGDLTTEELQNMQLHVDLLERLRRMAGDDHDHDTGGDHDHVHKIVE